MAPSTEHRCISYPWTTCRNLYGYCILNALDALAYCLTWPCYTSLGQCISCFIPTTGEQREPYRRLLHLLVLPWLYIALAPLTLPFALIGFLIERLLLKFRTRYRYYESQSKAATEKQLHYSFATANICLGPEWLCRYNNLGDNRKRARDIGAVICVQQAHSQHYNYNVANGTQPCPRPPRLGTCLDFPALDIICFQEVFDLNCAQTLIKEISPVFPYIVYDVQAGALTELINSGLMIASRQEITHVKYSAYEESIGVCNFVATGVLMCKVFLGRDPRTGKSSVGYVATTHLQPYRGDSPVLRHQLTELYRSVTSFRAQTLSRDDHVMFDVIAGDFNFDNMSPADSEFTNHPIFSQYTDLCRVAPGVDRNWAMGTERRQRTLHNHEASFPEGLKQCMDDKFISQMYLFNADLEKGKSIDAWAMPTLDEDGEMVASPVGGRRRVDYCLYNAEDALVVTGYNFVTQLASLTDHIPVSMTVMAPQL